ncbi:lipid droplet-associated protein [Pseudonocardia sp. KRD291]|uniref:lipid droplet-associated protein n=1 Tax=Pseudonocardia sp. KRD291 TaxID=2792007 RepID=UPI001C4A1AE4|nr:lipid droplet-associated protein [Pseudonocardia sp. KRD291]MBW0101584.1 lipid droplet-associated protein [Pseudonocardia sp. KRD291]
MTPLPFPLRIAAGLVVTAVEQARELPRHAVEFPVTAVSQALQASMRLQQTVTELAIKGDRALGTLRPAEDVPSWATFDDELPAADFRPRNGASTVSELRPSTKVTDIPVARPPKPAAPRTAAGTDAAATTPSVLPEYPSMTIPQLRGKLRALTLDDLADLLAWETSHGNRSEYVTMLTNRISTLSKK